MKPTNGRDTFERILNLLIREDIAQRKLYAKRYGEVLIKRTPDPVLMANPALMIGLVLGVHHSEYALTILQDIREECERDGTTTIPDGSDIVEKFPVTQPVADGPKS